MPSNNQVLNVSGQLRHGAFASTGDGPTKPEPWALGPNALRPTADGPAHHRAASPGLGSAGASGPAVAGGPGARPAAGPGEKALAVTTALPATITGTSAVLGGTAPAAGGATERGVVYSASAATPAIGNGNKVQIGSGPGRFSQSVSLSSNTTYHVRAYAVTAAGPVYGSPVAFKTLPALSATVAVQRGAGPASGSNAVKVAAVGGSAPYAYSWRNTTASITLAQTGAVVAGLPPGSYTVTVTDETGATTTASIAIP